MELLLLIFVLFIKCLLGSIYFTNSMESKFNQQQNIMISLAKPKYKTSLPENQNTWGNLLNKKSTSTNTAIDLKKKPKEKSIKSDKLIKSKNLNVLKKIF